MTPLEKAAAALAPADLVLWHALIAGKALRRGDVQQGMQAVQQGLLAAMQGEESDPDVAEAALALWRATAALLDGDPQGALVPLVMVVMAPRFRDRVKEADRRIAAADAEQHAA